MKRQEIIDLLLDVKHEGIPCDTAAEMIEKSYWNKEEKLRSALKEATSSAFGRQEYYTLNQIEKVKMILDSD